MKKKTFKVYAMLLAVAMLLSQALVPSLAETGNYCSVCKSNAVRGKKILTVDPTCKDDGYEVYECDYEDEDGKNCEGTITVTIPATKEHVGDGITHKKVEPTCTEKGTKAYELCKYCGKPIDPETGKELSTVEIPANGHTYDAVVTAPTCTEDGFTTYTCSVCEDTYKDDVVPATGHHYTVTVKAVAPTCQTVGYTEYKKCETCGAIDPENPREEIPAEDHGAVRIDHKDATCTEDGYDVFKCEKEGCPYNTEEGTKVTIKATGHSFEKIADKAATCETDGVKAHNECKTCGEWYAANVKDSDIKAKPINKDDYIIPATGHKPVVKEAVDATCDKDGKTSALVCDVCGKEFRGGEIIPAKGHTLVAVEGVDAECEKDGVIAHQKCTVCNKLFSKDAKGLATDKPLTSVKIPATGHKEITVKYTFAPTCTENGYIVKECKKCKKTFTETLKPTGHSFEFVEEQPAKCMEDGVKAHYECTACEKLFDIDKTTLVTEEDLKIAKYGNHKMVDVEAKNPTYTEAGTTAGRKCSREGCDYAEGAEVIEQLKAKVKFYYDITGINGSKTAVNSGTVKVKVYFDVLADENDKPEYNSDVFANISAANFAVKFDNTALTLTDVSVEPGVFDKAGFTETKKANENGSVAIAQYGTAKDFRGEKNAFATLTFSVNSDIEFGKDQYGYLEPVESAFEFAGLTAAGENGVVDSISENGMIEIVKLGDANGDGKLDAADLALIIKYLTDMDKETTDSDYRPEFDMDKNGVIDFFDLDALCASVLEQTV